MLTFKFNILNPHMCIYMYIPYIYIYLLLIKGFEYVSHNRIPMLLVGLFYPRIIAFPLYMVQPLRQAATALAAARTGKPKPDGKPSARTPAELS